MGDEDDLWKTLEMHVFTKEGMAIFNQVHGSSRRGWQGLATHKLCQLSKTKDLGFLYGSLLVESHWRFVDDKHGLGVCAHVFEPQELQRIVESIADLMNWIRCNIDSVSGIDLIKWNLSSGDVVQAFSSARISAYPYRSSSQGDDGEDPWYLFSYLVSIKYVMEEALKHQKGVLHASTVGWDLRDEWVDQWSA